MKNQLTPVIIVAVCALALGPLCTGFFGPEWRAKWLLASAANQFQNEQFDEAESTLERAADLSADLANDPEFWMLRFEILANKKNPSQEFLSRLYEESISRIANEPAANQANLAHAVGSLFHQCHQNQFAVELLEKFFPPISKRTPNENNSLAYFRSKTKKGLETALLEIDAALVKDGNSQVEFLDTKAWILHGLNRNEIALTFVQEAIRKKKESVGKLDDAAANLLQEWLFAASVVPASETASVSNKLEELKKLLPAYDPRGLGYLARGVAALRFHRACILDELGRIEDAEIDYAWLDSFGFQETDKLN